jgi:hypothetical protein
MSIIPAKAASLGMSVCSFCAVADIVIDNASINGVNCFNKII